VIEAGFPISLDC